jgi:hypothetical protein
VKISQQTAHLFPSTLASCWHSWILWKTLELKMKRNWKWTFLLPVEKKTIQGSNAPKDLDLQTTFTKKQRQ